MVGRMIWIKCQGGIHGTLPELLPRLECMIHFVYGHTRTLECMRHFTEGKEIIRPGVTRFASAFLTLNSMLEKKNQLKQMVVHSRWDQLKDVKSKKGKDATATILCPAF